MEIDLDFLAKLYAPFYTETGKKVAFEYVKLKFVDPNCILVLPPANPDRREPKTENPGEVAGEIFRDLATGIIGKERGEKLLKLAIQEARPVLLGLDSRSLGKAIEADERYKIRR